MRDGFWKSFLGLLILVTISAAAIYVKWTITQERERDKKAGKKSHSQLMDAPRLVCSGWSIADYQR